MDHNQVSLITSFVLIFTAIIIKQEELRLSQPLWPYKPHPENDSFIWTLDCKDDPWVELNLRY